MKTINRRENPRVEIKLRCHVTAPQVWLRSSLYTENISRGGVLISWRADEFAQAPPRIGQILTVEVELPANHSFGRKCIHCQGTVVRINPDREQAMRVAISLNYMDFRSFGDAYSSVHLPEPTVNTWMS